MGLIIAGHLPDQEQTESTVEALIEAGFAPSYISSFYLNPPGQHNLYPIGGDRNDSPGAHETSNGVVKGAASGGTIGAVVGLTGAPVFGPVGPAVGALVGAHLGGLVGSLSQMKEKGQVEDGTAEDSGAENQLHQRKSGMLVAVNIEVLGTANKAIRILRERGAQDIERASGHIAGGDWTDFDPLQPPHLIGHNAADQSFT